MQGVTDGTQAHWLRLLLLMLWLMLSRRVWNAMLRILYYQMLLLLLLVLLLLLMMMMLLLLLLLQVLYKLHMHLTAQSGCSRF
jgi:hypothetical protein